ncbi:class II aldolase/adducin family protein [Streptomyces sp. NPDC002640]
MRDTELTSVPDETARAWRWLVATARRTAEDGLVVGTSGNVSVRVGEDLVLVTPSGVPYDRLGPGHLVGVGLDGRRRLGTAEPTSELPLHLAVHRGTGARAVVHTHAVHATAVSTLVDELPPVHYMTAALGGPVRVAPYATYGTPELAEATLAALEDRTACLLRNHGTAPAALRPARGGRHRHGPGGRGLTPPRTPEGRHDGRARADRTTGEG